MSQYVHPNAVAPQAGRRMLKASLVNWYDLDRPDGTEPEVGAFAVVASQGSWVGRAIALSTRSFYNHAFLYVGHGQIIEGWWPVTRGVPINTWAAGPTRPSLPRRILWSDYDGNLHLTQRQQEDVVNLAALEIGSRYNLIQYLDFAAAFFGRDFKISDKSKFKVCSTLVAWTWEQVHTGLVMEADQTERNQKLRRASEPFLRWNEVSPAMLARVLGEQRLWLPKQ